MNKHLKYNIGFLFLILGFHLFGQVKIDTNENALLWKIEGNGIKESYLFGTIHLISKENYYFPKNIEKKLLKSKQVILEIANLPSAQEAQQLIQLEKGSFFDYFDSLQLDSLINWTRKNWGMNENVFKRTFEHLQPFAFSQMVLQLKYLDQSVSYDMEIMKMAKSNEITLLGFETLKDQLNYFNQMPKEVQTLLVMESIREEEQQDLLYKQMQNLYRQQDLKGLNRLWLNEKGVISLQQTILLDQRNLKWIALLEKNMLLDKTFIAVGAAHLSGNNGLIQLLRNKGYKLTPIHF